MALGARGKSLLALGALWALWGLPGPLAGGAAQLPAALWRSVRPPPPPPGSLKAAVLEVTSDFDELAALLADFVRAPDAPPGDEARLRALLAARARAAMPRLESALDWVLSLYKFCAPFVLISILHRLGSPGSDGGDGGGCGGEHAAGGGGAYLKGPEGEGEEEESEEDAAARRQLAVRRASGGGAGAWRPRLAAAPGGRASMEEQAAAAAADALARGGLVPPPAVAAALAAPPTAHRRKGAHAAGPARRADSPLGPDTPLAEGVGAAAAAFRGATRLRAD